MKVDNLTEQAIAAIKKAIVMGELKLGESISEIGICKKYNLSKTPVREALAILNHDELVNKVARRGSFVFDISLNDIEFYIAVSASGENNYEYSDILYFIK